MHYFAYGSNLSLKRIQARLDGVKRLGVGSVSGHRLAFHKLGQDDSAKCDIFASGDNADKVMGVLYWIDEADKAILDRIEGKDHGYQQKNVEVILADGSVVYAFTYYATATHSDIKPFGWYHHHVRSGATENELPPDYIRLYIDSVEPIDDQDRNRHQIEMSIYGEGTH